MRPARAHTGQVAATQSILKVMATVGLTPWAEETSVLTMALGLLVANVGVRTRLSSILSHGPASAAFLSPETPTAPHLPYRGALGGQRCECKLDGL